MTAIAGIIDFSSGLGAAGLCRDLLLAQREYGPHASSCGDDGVAYLGRALFRRFHEDRHDRQPARGKGQRMLVADVRLDNRDELCRSLRIDRPEALLMADSAIVLRAWERWGDELFEHLAGNYALALWDGSNRRLLLARDPFGQSPLHVASGDGWIAFASMPQALRALPGVDGSPNLVSLGAFVADLRCRGRMSYFEGVERIEPGHAMSVSPAGSHYWRHWDPAHRVRLSGASDLVEAFRFYLDQAVESCLRGAGNTVAAHLSGGWDSAAVASTAAMQLAPSTRLIAFTAAPPVDFSGAVPRTRIADESARAALVASLHSNVEHRVVRDRSERPIAFLPARNHFMGEPTGYVCNNMWWTSINRAASKETSILLTAQMGNHTLSAGGGMQLADLVRMGQMRHWLREARGLTGRRAMRWTGVLDQSFGPFIPFYRKLRPLLLRSGRKDGAFDLVAKSLRPILSRLEGRNPVEDQPSDSRAHRAAMLAEFDCGTARKTALAQWGLDERDPTTERRFVEFCLSLPQEALLRNGISRPVARAALANRVPAPIRDARDRGLQFADWYREISAGEVAQELAGAEELLDGAAVATLLAHWPSEGFERPSVVRTFRMDLMRAVGASSFLNTYSRSPSAAESELNVGSIEESRSTPGREKQE